MQTIKLMRGIRLSVVVVLVWASSWIAKGAEPVRREATAVNVEETTAEAAQRKTDVLWPFDRPVFDMLQKSKREMRERYGFEWALEYTLIYQATTAGIDTRQAAEGTLGVSGLWKILRESNGIDSAGIGFQLETRGNYMGEDFVDMTADLGSLWSPNDSTSDDYSKINQVWWAQKMAGGKLTYLLGKIDPGAYINGNRFAGSGNTQFFSQPFATNPARAFPDNGLGAMVRVAPVEWIYVHGVISDSDAVSSYSPFKSFDGNFFYAGEAGLKPKFAEVGEGNYRFTLWQRVTDSATSSGFALSFDQNLGRELGAFFRYGMNDGDLVAVEQIASAGVSFLRPFGRRDDQAGVGVSWTRPSDSDLRDEYSAEIYYRLQLTAGIEVSASAQLIEQPSASELDREGVFGFRMRFLY